MTTSIKEWFKQGKAELIYPIHEYSIAVSGLWAHPTNDGAVINEGNVPFARYVEEWCKENNVRHYYVTDDRNAESLRVLPTGDEQQQAFFKQFGSRIPK